jgi:hypothetical protein
MSPPDPSPQRIPLEVAGREARWAVWPMLLARMAGMPFDWIDLPETGDFAADREAADLAMDTIARHPRFSEAVLWQNPGLANTKLGHRYPPPKPTDGRYLRRSLWAYASRYCAKNDMIGFFGPVVWGRWAAGPTDIGKAATPARKSGVFFELWAIRAVAGALLARHGLARWTVPHLAPLLDRTAHGLRLGDGTTLRLTPMRQRIVSLCDGRRTIAELIAELVDEDPDQVSVEIDRLRRMGVLSQEFVLPRGLHPERALRGQLLRVTDPARRQAALAELDELTAARDLAAAATGDYTRLSAALAALDEVFVRLTAHAPRRADAEFYAGRTIVYHDCLGDTTVHLGQDILRRAAPVLELVLDGARWYCNRTADEYDKWLVATIKQWSESYPDGVPLVLLVKAIGETVVPGAVSPPAELAADELRRRWEQLLVPDPALARVCHRSEDLRPQLDAAFATAAPRWALARWHSPDLMLSARSYQDLLRGDYQCVLGELHPSLQTIDILPAYVFNPDQEQVRRLTDELMRDDRFTPIYQYASGLLNSRTLPPDSYLSPRYTYLGIGNEPSYHPREARMLPASGLVGYVGDGGEARVRSVAGDFDADAVTVLGEFLSHALAQRYGFLPRRAHMPRVTIDDVVVCRETWRIPHAALGDLSASAPDWYARIRHLRTELGLPRHVFATVPGERKPFHVDLANPLALAVLAHRLRRRSATAGQLTLTEMVPGPDELWLTDDQGQRYTVEFRFVSEDRRR